MIRVAIADDQELIREGFTLILDAQPDLEVVGAESNGEEAIELVRAVKQDVVLAPDVTRRLVEEYVARGTVHTDPAINRLSPGRWRSCSWSHAVGPMPRSPNSSSSARQRSRRMWRASWRSSLRNRVQAVVYAYEHGLVTAGNQGSARGGHQA